jgi:RTX calcium-binding nonapeptide repeat (4 copies)
MRCAPLMLAATVMLGMALVSAAHAGTVRTTTDPTAFPTATFEVGHGEVNDLEVERAPVSAPTLVFTDAGSPLSAGDGCAFTDSRVWCFPALGLDVFLGDRDDSARVSVTGPGRVWAGSGDDTVNGATFNRPMVVYGEAGHDELHADGVGGQLIDGGRGHDILHVGGFEGETTGIGGPGQDVIDVFVHHSGQAIIDAGEGHDRITLQPGTPSRVAAGLGRDIVRVEGRLPTFSLGGHTIHGGSGGDTLSGGPDDDAIDAGPGNDSIEVSGGSVDTVSCGAGRDSVRAGPDDTVAEDCERVRVTTG